MSELPLNVYETRVRSHQTDLNGAMYHGAYFDVFDEARIDTFRRLDYTYQRALAANWSLVIRRVQCEYLRPARMDELIRVTVLVPALTPATMTARYECRRESELLAVGEVVYVFLDARGRPIRVPRDLRTLIDSVNEFHPDATTA
jgi:acyl-CoA thioester hydrolase